MTSAGSSAEPNLTRKQREWLRHLRACHRSRCRVKDYAAEHGIPVQALYQAAKRLRQRGVLAPSGRWTRRPEGFVKVAVAPASAEGRSVWRIRLPSGTVFESTTPLSEEQLLPLLERLAHVR
jgi:hypothetical protein